MKKNTKKIISGVLATSVMLQSCDPKIYFYDDEIEDINDSHSKENNSEIIPIQIIGEESDLKYIQFINMLSLEIINKPDVAKEFISNTDKFLKEKGYEDLDINIDDYLLRIITLFGDEDLNKAIKENDINAYMEQMYAKGYMNELNKSDFDRINRLIEDNPELFANLGLIKTKSSLAVVAFTVAAVVAAIVYLGAAVVNYVGAATLAIAAAVAVTTLSITGGGGSTPDPYGDPIYSYKSIRLDDDVLKIWAFKGGNMNKLSILADKQLSLRVDNILKDLNKKNPELMSAQDVENIKQLILLNVTQHNL